LKKERNKPISTTNVEAKIIVFRNETVSAHDEGTPEDIGLDLAGAARKCRDELEARAERKRMQLLAPEAFIDGVLVAGSKVRRLDRLL
jgi:hypothetical protein